jgi:hypothetical protein
MTTRAPYLPVLVLSLMACGKSSYPPDSVARPVSGAIPVRFLFDATGFQADTMISSPKCRTPLVDPNDGTRIALARAVEGGRGDYEVPDGHYGVGRDDLLRINCKTGGVIGIVPKATKPAAS